MNNRISKYQDYANEEEKSFSRVKKNTEMYEKLNDYEISDFDLEKKETVISSRQEEIDLEKLKEAIDENYEALKRKSIPLEEDLDITLVKEKTKEYDINTILSKARDEKPVDYNEERSKKIRDTQYNILNKIDLAATEKEKTDLLDLINTITLNETKSKIDADLFPDLKSDEEETEIVEKTEETEKIETSFFTKSSKFKKKDFEGEEKKVKETTKKSVLGEIVVVLILISFLVGLFIFVKSLMNF